MSITRVVLLSLFLLLCISAVPAGNLSQNSGGNANQLVQTAFATMQRLSSYKARADLAIGSRRARIDAEVGVGKVAMSTLGFDGKRSRNIVTNQQFFLSTDDGKSWQPDTEKLGLVRYNFIGGVLEPSLKLHEQGEWKVVGKETIEGVETIHLRINAETPVDLWVAEDATLGKYVRRIHIVMEGTDGGVDNTITYFDLNKPVAIEIPK